MFQIHKNPEFFLPIFAVFGAQQLTAPQGNETFWPAGFSATSRERIYHPPGEQQTRGQSRFFIDDVLIVLGSRAWVEMCLWSWGVCAAGSPLRVTENTSWVASWCLRPLPGTTDVVTHRMRSVPEFRGLLLLVRSYSCPPVKCNVGGCLLSHVVYPKFRPILTTAAPQSRGVGLCWEPEAANLKRIRIFVDQTLLMTVRYLQGSNQLEVQT